MKKLHLATLLTFLVFMLASCQVIGGIFKAGVWTGIILVVIVIAVIIWLLSRGKS